MSKKSSIPGWCGLHLCCSSQPKLQILANSLMSARFTHTKRENAKKAQSHHPRLEDLVGLRPRKWVSCGFTHLSLREEWASATVRLKLSPDVVLARTRNPLMGSRQWERKDMRRRFISWQCGLWRGQVPSFEPCRGGKEWQDKSTHIKSKHQQMKVHFMFSKAKTGAKKIHT